MKKMHLMLLVPAFLALVQLACAQNVKLANVATGMTEAEVRQALASNSPVYMQQASEFSDLYYLIAETDAESFAFTIIEGRVAAFSLTHILPPGQQSFLPQGQDPTVSTLRNLISKRTWEPAEIRRGDTLWLSNAAGMPTSDAAQCRQKHGEEWMPMGTIAASGPGREVPKSTAGLMKPSLVSYPSACAMSIHLKMTPDESDSDRVSIVHMQVLDMRMMNAFLTKHPDSHH